MEIAEMVTERKRLKATILSLQKAVKKAPDKKSVLSTIKFNKQEVERLDEELRKMGIKEDR